MSAPYRDVLLSWVSVSHAFTGYEAGIVSSLALRIGCTSIQTFASLSFIHLNLSYEQATVVLLPYLGKQVRFPPLYFQKYRNRRKYKGGVTVPCIVSNIFGTLFFLFTFFEFFLKRSSDFQYRYNENVYTCMYFLHKILFSQHYMLSNTQPVVSLHAPLLVKLLVK